MTNRGPANQTLDLFRDDTDPQLGSLRSEPLADGAVVLRAQASSLASSLLAELQPGLREAVFRHQITPGGHRMSVAMTNCGEWGWVSDASGYRYTRVDPLTQRPWPAIPPALRALARSAAAQAGFEGFEPDACLINRYEPGARLTAHQDRNERDFAHPIVSVSLGLPAVFLFGGLKRAQRFERVPLRHGDVVVWGGPARLRHHAVLPLRDGWHPLTGACRINLTLRRAA